MSDEFESGAFARSAAWHGHGKVVEGAMTTKEAFTESGYMVERYATEDEIEATKRLREEANNGRATD